jgi:hypothetical protein
MLSTQPDPLPPPCYKLYEYIPLYLYTQGRGKEGEGGKVNKREV